MTNQEREALNSALSRLPQFPPGPHLGGFLGGRHNSIAIYRGDRSIGELVDRVREGDLIRVQRWNQGMGQCQPFQRRVIRRNATLHALSIHIPGLVGHMWRPRRHGDGPAVGGEPRGMIAAEPAFSSIAASDQQVLAIDLVEGTMPDPLALPPTRWISFSELKPGVHALLSEWGPASVRSIQPVLGTGVDGIGWVGTQDAEPMRGDLLDVLTGKVVARDILRSDAKAISKPVRGTVHLLELSGNDSSMVVSEFFARLPAGLKPARSKPAPPGRVLPPVPFERVAPHSMTIGDASAWYREQLLKLPEWLDSQADDLARLRSAWFIKNELRNNAVDALYSQELSDEFRDKHALPSWEQILELVFATPRPPAAGWRTVLLERLLETQELRALAWSAAMQEVLARLLQPDANAFPRTVGESVGLRCWDGKRWHEIGEDGHWHAIEE